MHNNPLQHLVALLSEKLITVAPQTAAQTLGALATHEVLMLVNGLKAQSLVALFNPMAPAKAAAVLRRLPFKQACYVLTHLQVPQAAKIWKEFAAPYQARLTGELSPAFVALLQTAHGFNAQQAGCYMSTDVVAVLTDTPVSELVARLKNLPRKKLPLVCFVTGKNGELKGVIFTAELVFLNPQALCGSVMNKTVCALHAQTSLAQAQALFDQQGVRVLPVVNEEGVLVGQLDKESVLVAVPAKKTWWEKLKD